MGFANRLCNPTPWDAQWDYSRGIVLYIPAFSTIELKDIQMVDDFRPDKAGAENVQMNMATLGIFLLDPNKTYDSQALALCKSMQASLTERFKASTQNIRNQLALKNQTIDGEPYEELLRQHGLDIVRDKITALKGLEKQYQAAVDLEIHEAQGEKFDPERTVFVTDPPREFPSKAAMLAFLASKGNESVRKEHSEWIARLNAPKKATKEIKGETALNP